VWWKHYLLLERDVQTASEYVEFEPAQEKVYSHHLARLLLAIGSEVDVVAKALCKSLSSPTVQNIGDYRNCITQSRRSGISRFQVEDLRHRFGSLCPWQKWVSGQSPDWWTAYNDVKHDRSNQFAQASVGNVFSALAGLFALNLYLKAEQTGPTCEIPQVESHESSILFNTQPPPGGLTPATIMTEYYIV
jgi:hypothetical protein